MSGICRCPPLPEGRGVLGQGPSEAFNTISVYSRSISGDFIVKHRHFPIFAGLVCGILPSVNSTGAWRMARMGSEDWGKAVTHFECELLKVNGYLEAAKASAAQLSLQVQGGDSIAVEAQAGIRATVDALLARRHFLGELVVEMRDRHLDIMAEEAV
jgi:hypothetical protein